MEEIRNTQFSSENFKERNNSGDLGIDGKIILK
jgi:hypothetical protein